MTEDAAESINVHAIHQAALCEIVPQTMRGNILIQAHALQIVLEVCFKVADLNVISCVASGRKQIIAVRITVLELNPSSENALRF